MMTLRRSFDDTVKVIDLKVKINQWRPKKFCECGIFRTSERSPV